MLFLYISTVIIIISSLSSLFIYNNTVVYSEGDCALTSNEGKKMTKIIKKGTNYVNKDNINWTSLSCAGPAKGFYKDNYGRKNIDVPTKTVSGFIIDGLKYVSLK